MSIISNKEIDKMLPFDSKKSIIKVVDLYPSNLDSFIKIKESHVGCVYYIVTENPEQLSLDNYLIPYFNIPVSELKTSFPFEKGEVDLYIYNGSFELNLLETTV